MVGDEMPRFFSARENIQDNTIKLTGSDAEHISRVLRSEIGDSITVCDSMGNDYNTIISEISKNEISLEIKERFRTESEPSIKITLYQGLPKGDKMDLIIQKCVEIGVYKIVPVNTERCIVKLDKNKERKKLERWQKISEAAAKQCGRGIIPEIGNIINFDEAIKNVGCDRSIIPYELENDRGLKSFLKDYSGESIAVFIGPEGGFAKDEIDKAINCGIVPVTLGKRILRTETAGLISIANMLFYLDM
ncbi:ribosomal RNA small subunit methyltransferase E [Clostridiales bacterium]|nr:ribosomal RNA small subunit methyltransferase E [Clostridiales bacterium]